MVAEKRPPALGRWPKAAAHIPSDRRLGDLEAKLEQLTMNAWCAPESICAAHLANERAQLNRDLRSANTVARPPAPIRPKACGFRELRFVRIDGVARQGSAAR